MSIEFFEEEVRITLGSETTIKNLEEAFDYHYNEMKPKSDKLYFVYKKEQQLYVNRSKNLVSLLSKSGFTIATEKLFTNKKYK